MLVIVQDYVKKVEVIQLNISLKKDNSVQVLRKVETSSITDFFQEPVFISLNSHIEIQIVFTSFVLIMTYLSCLKFSSGSYFIVSQSLSHFSDILQSLP